MSAVPSSTSIAAAIVEKKSPTQKKFWQVVRVTDGALHNMNGKGTIENKEAAQTHADSLAVQHTMAFAVMETVYAVQPQFNVDQLQIVD